MPKSFELTDQHCQILKPLTSKVRVLTYTQIARTLFSLHSHQDEQLQRMVTELEESDFLTSFSAMVHPEIVLDAPLCRYSPGDRQPDFLKVARETRGRWKRAPVMTKIVYATKRAQRVFGGYLGGKKPRPSETRHDIHVAQLYLNLCQRDPAAAAAWISEAQLRQERGPQGGPLPDAVIRTAEPVIIEFGGAYSRQKLEAFHVQQKTKTYEIW